MVPPIVLLTSNSTRDLGDALKRRCLHLHIGFPDAKLEARIIASRVPGIEAQPARATGGFVQQLRALDLKKVPSVSETIDWARVLLLLHAAALEVDMVHDTLNVLLKFEADIEVADKQLAALTQKARQEAGPVTGRPRDGIAPLAAASGAAAPQFLQAARGAGMRVSAAEGIDAARAVQLVGFADRTVLKDTLALVLAKTPDEKAPVRRMLRSLLQARRLRAGRRRRRAAMPQTATAARRRRRRGHGRRRRRFARRRCCWTTTAPRWPRRWKQAAREAGIENIRFFTQKNLYARRILDRMGLREVERDMEALRQATTRPTPRPIVLEERIEALRDQARDLVERNLLLFARGETEKFREELLKSARLSNLERRDLDRMRVLVRAMAKRLAARYAKTRRRRLRGQLDVRRTLRRNMGWGGMPFVTVWKQKRIEKPRVMVLCDVSGSVAAMAQFLLMFLYALNEALSDIRSLRLRRQPDRGQRHPGSRTDRGRDRQDHAAIGFGSSNYGNSLADFEDGWMRYVTNKTTIIILGDARGNRTDPRTDILQRMSQRAKRIIWLNPEYRSAWGTGDSDMFRYAPYCNVVDGVQHAAAPGAGGDRSAEGRSLTVSRLPAHALAAAIVAHSSSTMRPTSASSSASAITRISGSVPLSRISRRPAPSSCRLGRGDRLLDALAAQRRGAGEAHVLQQLRQRREHAADLARRASLLDDDRQHLQRRQQPVAGGGEVGQDHVAGLLAAEVHAASRIRSAT